MRSRNNLCTIGFTLLAMLTGCDDPTAKSNPTTKPTVAIATSEPTETPAVLAAFPTRPPCSLNLDGRDELFPAAKLAVLSHGTGGITLRLCSDDPANAIDPGYVGNSFVIDMRLGIDRIEDIPACAWDFKSSDGDDTSGIYLHGYRDQYRPVEVHVTFQKDGNDLLACINGTFLHNDNQNPAAPPQRVAVSGCLRSPAIGR